MFTKQLFLKKSMLLSKKHILTSPTDMLPHGNNEKTIARKLDIAQTSITEFQ